MSRAQRLAKLAFAAASLAVIALAFRAHVVVPYRARQMTHDVMKELFRPGPASPADTAMDRVIVAAARGDCAAVATLMTADLEPASPEPVFRRWFTYADFLPTAKALQGAIIGEIAAGRAGNALAMLEATHRMCRLFGRGFWKVAVEGYHWEGAAARRRLDLVVRDALDGRRIPVDLLPRLDAIYADVLAREPEPRAVMDAYADTMELIVRRFDEREGFKALFAWPLVPDGPAQVDALRDAWEAGRDEPDRRCDAPHPVVAYMAREIVPLLRCRAEAQAVRHEIRALIAIQRRG